jgi:Protein of unknown function (DUF2933)
MSTTDHSAHDHNTKRNFFASPVGLVLAGFFLIAAVFLFVEHRAHALGVLIYLPLLLCPLMHFFMHGSHGSHGSDGQADR